MTLSFIRSFFIIVSTVVGYYVGSMVLKPLLGAQIGCLGALVMIFLESRLKRVSVRGLSSVVFGLLLGVIMAKLLSNILALMPIGVFNFSVAEIVLTLVFSYFGAVMALRGKDEFNIIIPYVRFRRQDTKDGVVLLDTCAIIDGRISDIYKTHFLSGRLVVPRSVLLELQKLADSENDIKRQRGRRGMDLIGEMQNDPKVDVHIHEDDMDKDVLVDDRLIHLAKVMDATLCTTDYNLNRVATLQGVTVLNINDLVGAVKPVIYSGDAFEVKIIKEGKESNQGVAYLDDGTMVVVSDARELIGETRKVYVTSILQTQAGKMIFASIVTS